MSVPGRLAPSDVEIFLRAGEQYRTGLVALSAAESLTDDLARYLLELVNTHAAELFVDALHICDFVVERNSEWNLAPRARQYLLIQLTDEPAISQTVHTRLLEIAQSAGLQHEFSELPAYLTEGPGQAYHLAAINAHEGLLRYSQLAMAGVPRVRWLASQLAREQQTLGVLPQSALEVTFLQGMVYYREGRVSEAEPLLRSVANSGHDRIEVAVSSHIVGRINARRYRSRTAERLLKRSVRINRSLSNNSGEAQVLHTLGQLVGRNRKRAEEAEGLLRRSLKIERRQNHEFGEAQVLHTLGQLVGRDRRRAEEAEGLLRRSLEIGESQNNEMHQAQVLHTLGQLVGRNRKRAEEAEGLLRRSLEIGERRNNRLHEAQVLYTLGKLRSSSHRKSDREDAVTLLRRSLSLNREIGDHAGARLVERELRDIPK